MMELDLVRGFLIIVVFGVMDVFFIIMGLKISRNVTYKISDRIFLAGAFLLYALGASINITYYLLASIIGILHDQTILLILVSIGNSILFIINLFYLIFQYSKRNKKFTPKYQYYAAGLFIVGITSITFFFVFKYVEFNESTDWAPLYHPEFSLYYGLILTIFILLEAREAFKIYKYIKHDGTNWKLFNIGIIGIPTLMILIAFSDMTLNPLIRGIFTGSFIIMFLFAIFIFKGLTGKKERFSKK